MYGRRGERATPSTAAWRSTPSGPSEPECCGDGGAQVARCWVLRVAHPRKHSEQKQRIGPEFCHQDHLLSIVVHGRIEAMLSCPPATVSRTPDPLCLISRQTTRSPLASCLLQLRRVATR